MDNLVSLSNTLIESTSTGFVRFMNDRINWDSRLTAILGAKGTGKTTLLLQHIKLQNRLDETLYVNADDFYFSENRLFYQRNPAKGSSIINCPLQGDKIHIFSFTDYQSSRILNWKYHDKKIHVSCHIFYAHFSF